MIRGIQSRRRSDDRIVLDKSGSRPGRAMARDGTPIGEGELDDLTQVFNNDPVQD
jgi:hypothetical protein